jgi:hypothetical protein
MRLFSDHFCIPFPKKIIFITSELITTKDPEANLINPNQKTNNFSEGSLLPLLISVQDFAFRG